jgi:hypothetical protein
VSRRFIPAVLLAGIAEDRPGVMLMSDVWKCVIKGGPAAYRIIAAPRRVIKKGAEEACNNREVLTGRHGDADAPY